MVQIDTGLGRPLDATMLAHAVRALAPAKHGLVLIDNSAT